MRVMNGRLHNLIRSPLTRNKFLTSDNDVDDVESTFNSARNDDEDNVDDCAVLENGHSRKHRHHHHRHRHRHSNKDNNNGCADVKTKKKMALASSKGRPAKKGKAPPRRRNSEDSPLPKSIQFDESSDAYRCLCSCFHVKTGGMCIAGIEIFIIFCYFVNALTILLQQKQAYGNSRTNGPTPEPTSADYVSVTFAVASTALALALFAVLLMLVGLTRNIASLLIPHLLAQAITILCLTGLLLAGIVALITDHAYFYRLLNAAPFNDFPGQVTVAFDAETAMRVHIVLATYALTLALELWFIVIVYNCYGYFTERRKYMNYCLAYSTPMKTLNSARYN